MSKFSLLSNNSNQYTQSSTGNVHEYGEEIAQLKGEVERLDLVTEAMWNLLKDKGFAEDDLIKAITDLDAAKKQKKLALEDGEKQEAQLCPYCHVPLQNNGQLADRCIYCGHEIITSPFK